MGDQNSGPVRGIPQREASITMYQQVNGYWHCELSLIVPMVGCVEDSASSFHNADECLAWARGRIEDYVTAASGWFR